MEQLTQMELLQVEEHLRSEELAAKKCSVYARMCTDDTLKGLFQEAAQRHQGHYQGLLQKLQELHGRPRSG